VVRQTSSTHGPDGYITTNTAEIEQILNRLNQKLESTVEQFSFYECYKPAKAETLMITYGVSARAAKAVYKKLIGNGEPVALLILKTLWPLPETVIRRTARNVRRVVVVEMNLGQYVYEIERLLPNHGIDFIGQMNGQLIAPKKIAETIVNG
jgi:2-oxoglutarate ferredoxin oxidoreductase subunit alpha